MRFARRLDIKLARLMREPGVPRMLYRAVPLLVLLISLVITFNLWSNAQDHADSELQAEFNSSTQEVVHEIKLRMAAHELLLHGLQGLFASSGEITRAEFQTYISALDLGVRYPGIQGVGFSLIIPAAQREAHVAGLHRAGFQKYRVWPEHGSEPVTSIVYVEPFSGRNLRAFGYDMYTNPVRREAMDRARDLGQPSLSGKVFLQQEDGDNKQPGFVMYLPIYQNGANFRDTAERRAGIIGWVHAHFRAEDLISTLSTGQKNHLDLTIYDGENISDETRLTGTVQQHAKDQSWQHRSPLTAIRPLTIAGHTWTLEARSQPTFGARFDNGKPVLIAISGIGVGLLLTLLLHLLIRGREQALRMAEDMNHELIKSEYRWKYALEGAGEGVWDWNIASGSVFLSRRLKEILGYAEDELENRYESWEQNLHPEDRQKIVGALNLYLAGHSGEFSEEARMLCKDGSWKWILIRGMVVSRESRGKPLRMIGTHSDVSERHKKDESLRLASVVFNTTHEALMVTDASEHVVAVNPAFTRITGYSAEEIIGQRPNMLFEGTIAPETEQEMLRALRDEGSWQGEIVQRKKGGESYVAWISTSRVQDSKEQLSNYVTLFSDISERKASEIRMHYLAHYDHLTGLPNRALFTDRLRQALATARRNNSLAALMFVDLDKFKPVNDQLGHNIGDLLLQEVAHRLQDCIRESDTAARIGGDEFVVLLPKIEAEPDATMVATKILQALQQSFELAGHEIRISASIGIAVYPEHGKTDESILTNADNAMYHAKRGGGNAIVSFGAMGAEATSGHTVLPT